MKRHKIIEIIGKKHYYVRIDSNNRMVIVDPHNDYLYMKDLRPVFNEFYSRALFLMFDDDVDPDVYVAEDIYARMLEKNPDLQKLADTFDTTIVS